MPTLPGRDGRGLHLPSALREPGNCRARHGTAVQCAARRDAVENRCRPSNKDDLQPPPYRDLYEDHPLAWQKNIFNLAKNAGTSVNQIERFYARNLPLSAEMAKNLQSFGEG